MSGEGIKVVIVASDGTTETFDNAQSVSVTPEPAQPVSTPAPSATPTLPTLNGVYTPSPITLVYRTHGVDTILGDGATIVNWGKPGASPTPSNISGPFLTTDNYLRYQETQATGHTVYIKDVKALMAGLAGDNLTGDALSQTSLGNYNGASPAGGSTTSGGGSTGGGSTSSGNLLPPVDTTKPVSGSFSAAIARHSDGVVFTFNKDSGYVGDTWTNPVTGTAHTTVFCQDPNTFLTVIFKNYVDGSYDEVIVELGNPDAPKAALVPDFGAYTLTIYKNGIPFGTHVVPAHYWGSRVRWESAPFPLGRNAAQLISSKFVLPYDKTAVGARPLPPAAPPCGVMEISNVTAYMPTTGERIDIGLENEYTSAYIATQDESIWPSCDAWAEASFAFPWHVRDWKVNTPFNIVQRPHDNTYQGQSTLTTNFGTPSIVSKGAVVVPSSGVGYVVQGAHFPSLSYIRYLRTGHSTDLEEMQFAFMALFAADPWSAPTLYLWHRETREWAWLMRHLAQCIICTPASAPKWLIPQSAFKTIYTNTIAKLQGQYLTSPMAGDASTTFHSINSLGNTAPSTSGGTQFWEEEYQEVVMGWMYQTGQFPEMLPILQYKIGSPIARSNGTSGWLRNNPSCYVVQWGSAQTWGDLYTQNATAVSDLNVPVGTTGIVPRGNDYATYVWSALRVAVACGITDASAPLSWMDAQVRSSMTPEWRFSF